MDGFRVAVTAALLAMAVVALGAALALVAARLRVQTRSALAGPFTFALLAIAAGAAAGAIAAVMRSERLGIAAAALAAIATLSIARVGMLRREHFAIVGGVGAVDEARATARASQRALAASGRLAERVEGAASHADVESLVLDATRRALGDAVPALLPADTAPPAGVYVQARCDLAVAGCLRATWPGASASRQTLEAGAVVIRTLATEAMLGYERMIARSTAAAAELRSSVVGELDRRLGTSDDAFGASHLVAQVAAERIGAEWAEVHSAQAGKMAFALDGRPDRETHTVESPLAPHDGTLLLGLPGRPDLETTRMADAIAAALGRALDQIRFRRAAGERRLRQTALSAAASAVGRSNEPLRAILDQALKALHGDAAVAYVVRGGVPVAVEVSGAERPERCDGAASQAIATGRPVLDADGRFLEGAPLDGLVAAVAAPIQGPAAARGALSVLYRDATVIADADGTDLAAFAQLGALVVDRQQLDRELERRERLRVGFVEIAEGLFGPRDPTEAYVAVAAAARRALRAAAAVVVAPGADGLRAAGAAPAAPALVADDGTAGALLDLAARDGRVVLCTDARSDRRIPAAERKRLVEARQLSAICVPIAVPGGQGDAVLGVVWAQPRGAADDDLELARHLATAASAAIERAEVLAAERRARASAQELQRIGGLMASNLDAPAVLREIVSQAAQLLNADSCALRLVEGDRLVVRAVQGEAAELLAGEQTSMVGGPIGDVLSRRTPLAVADMSADDRFSPNDPLLEADFRAYLGSPILSPNGDLRGVLALYDRRRRVWKADEIEALEAFANSAAVALHNALLYQRVAQEKEKSEAIIASIADGIVVIDTDGRVEMWNRAAESMTGVPVRAALRRTLHDVLRSELGDHDDAAGKALVDAERGGGAVEVRLARGEREIWLSARAAQLRDPIEDRVGTVYALRDVSEDRQLDQLKSDFVATVSHELRTPLTSIYGFAETLLRGDVAFPEEDRRTFLSYIANESERLTRLVDGLLSVTRLEAGGVHLDLQDVDVCDVLRETVVRESGRAMEKHRFELKVPGDPLVAAADRDKLRQIVLNLVDNAIKYSPDGGAITVSAQRRLDSVEVRVQDEGIGISAADQRNLFRKFFRADARMTRGIRGIGLGLYLTRGFVTAMGGRIRVESSQGEGTTFIFDLPLRRGSGGGVKAA